MSRHSPAGGLVSQRLGVHRLPVGSAEGEPPGPVKRGEIAGAGAEHGHAQRLDELAGHAERLLRAAPRAVYGGADQVGAEGDRLGDVDAGLDAPREDQAPGGRAPRLEQRLGGRTASHGDPGDPGVEQAPGRLGVHAGGALIDHDGDADRPAVVDRDAAPEPDRGEQQRVRCGGPHRHAGERHRQRQPQLLRRARERRASKDDRRGQAPLEDGTRCVDLAEVELGERAVDEAEAIEAGVRAGAREVSDRHGRPRARAWIWPPPSMPSSIPSFPPIEVLHGRSVRPPAGFTVRARSGTAHPSPVGKIRPDLGRRVGAHVRLWLEGHRHRALGDDRAR